MDPAVSSCYAVEYGGKIHGGGRIVLTWQVSPDGRVRDVAVAESTFDSEVFEGCVTQAAKELKFPMAPGATEVVKAFNLRRAKKR